MSQLRTIVLVQFVVAFTLFACTHSAPNYVGVATMANDRTITLQLRSDSPDGSVAEGLFTYKPGDPGYDDVLRHIGGLKPGEEKPVPPWPPSKASH